MVTNEVYKVRALKPEQAMEIQADESEPLRDVVT
jgi:hypothetical protein